MDLLQVVVVFVIIIILLVIYWTFAPYIRVEHEWLQKKKKEGR